MLEQNEKENLPLGFRNTLLRISFFFALNILIGHTCINKSVLLIFQVSQYSSLANLVFFTVRKIIKRIVIVAVYMVFVLLL